MEKRKKLSQLYLELNVPRTTLQDWVNKILDDSDYRVGRGVTRYFGEDEIKKLWLIKELKEYDELCGKSNSPEYTDEKIKKIIHGKDPNFNEIEFRKKYLELLKRKRDEYDMQIRAQEAALEGVTIQALHSFIPGFENWDYNRTREYLSLIGKNLQLSHNVSDEEYEKFYSGKFTDEDIDTLINSFEQLSELCEKKYSSDSIEVFEIVLNIHRSVAKAFTGSVSIFSGLSMFVLSNNDFISEFDNDKIDFFRKAVQNYCRRKSPNSLDKDINAVIKKFELIFDKEYDVDSLQTQDIVKQLYSIIDNIKFIPKNQRLNILKNLAEVIKLENSNLCIYIADAINVYCEKIEMEVSYKND